MPAEIPLPKAKELVTATLNAVSSFTNKAIEMSRGATSVFVSGRIAAASSAVTRDLQTKINQRLLHGLILPAQRAGRTTVPSRLFPSNISLMIDSVADGYESLEHIDEIKPFLIRNMPFTLSLIAKIGSVAVAIGKIIGAAVEGLQAAVDAVSSGTEMLITALKWGSIAGGLYLLYGALKPEKAKR